MKKVLMAKSEKFKLSVGFSIMLLFLGMVFVFVNFQLPALAKPTDSVGGWGWSSNIGWISMNCDNTSCGPSYYGVNANLITGEITGYAWSQIGWISFETDDVAGCPSGWINPSIPCEPMVDWASKKVTGWAKILSNNSWISLSCLNMDTCAASDYEVTYSKVISPDNQFRGWAYGSDSIGWISFNCDNEGCGPSDYNVFRKPGTGDPPTANFEFCRDPDTDEIIFFDLSYAAPSSIPDPIEGYITQWYWDFDDDTNSSVQYPPAHTFDPDDIKYTVKLSVVDDDFNVITTNQVVDPDSEFISCEFELKQPIAMACNIVDLQWDEAMGAKEKNIRVGFGFDKKYNIYRCDSGPSDCDPFLDYNVVYTMYSDEMLSACSWESCSWRDSTTLPQRVYSYYVRVSRVNGPDLNNSTGSIPGGCTGGESNICPLWELTPDCIASNLRVTAACRENLFEWTTIAAAEGHNVYASIVDADSFPDPGFDNTKIVASTFPEEFCPGVPLTCSQLNPPLTDFYKDNDVLSDVKYFYSVSVIYWDELGITLLAGGQPDSVSGTPRCYRGPVYIEQ